MKKLLTLILSFCIMFTLIIPSQAKADNTKLKLNKSKATMEVDGTLKLKLGDIRGNKVKWSSNNKNVATVSKWGVVTAKSEGVVYIVAKYDNVKYKCRITINNKEKTITDNKKEESMIELVKVFDCNISNKDLTAFIIKNKVGVPLLITIKIIDENQNVINTIEQGINEGEESLVLTDFVDIEKNQTYSIEASDLICYPRNDYITTTVREIQNGIEITYKNKRIGFEFTDSCYAIFFKDGEFIDIKYKLSDILALDDMVFELTTEKEYDKVKVFFY